MADDIHQIIADFRATGWESAPYERTIAILADNPAVAEELVRRVIRELSAGPTFLHYAIDCLPDAAFPDLVPFALDAVGDNPENEGAEDLIHTPAFSRRPRCTRTSTVSFICNRTGRHTMGSGRGASRAMLTRPS